jgi:hypothetical protein
MKEGRKEGRTDGRKDRRTEGLYRNFITTAGSDGRKDGWKNYEGRKDERTI